MFRDPFSFRGRIRRTEFGISYAIGLFCVYGILYIVGLLGINGMPVLAHLTAIYWFIFSQGAKRCHDMGNSGFFQLIPFYILAMIFNKGENRANKYGQDPILVEFQKQETVLPVKTKEIILPKGKQLNAVGSELLSGVLLTLLAVALVGYFPDKNGWSYFIVQSLIIMAGYYMVLLFGFKEVKMSKLTNFFLLHRAIFSIACHIGIWSYEVYVNTIPDLNYSTIADNISAVLAIFIITYLPYHIFKIKKTPSPIPLEA